MVFCTLADSAQVDTSGRLRFIESDCLERQKPVRNHVNAGPLVSTIQEDLLLDTSIINFDRQDEIIDVLQGRIIRKVLYVLGVKENRCALYPDIRKHCHQKEIDVCRGSLSRLQRILRIR